MVGASASLSIPFRNSPPVHQLERGEVRARRVKLLIASLSRGIAVREATVIREKMGWQEDAFEIVEVKGSSGPGNVILIECEAENITEVFVAFGQESVPAGSVAENVVTAVGAWLGSGVPVGRFLADQLLLPFALAGGGSFITSPLSRHSLTNIDVIRQFLDIKIAVENPSDRTCLVKVG